MSKLIDANISNFVDEVIFADVPVLVIFHSEATCLPCRMLRPILAELADELGDRAKVVMVNMNVSEDIGDVFLVDAVPIMIVFREGFDEERILGLKSKEYLREMLLK